MQISDLISLGKLGNKTDADGFIKFTENSNFHPRYFSVKDFFLIFTDNRVRYVTIDKVQNENGFRIKFLEADVVEEIVKANNVKLSLPQSDLDLLDEKSGVINPTGMKIIFNEQNIGTVMDKFNNSVYDILVVKMKNNKELLIPDVKAYIKEKNPERNEIVVTNIEELMDL
ncbi:MAG: hypothetical protein DRZ79_05680 [Candidatus Cloacimonadota bacterium]|nr:MAG: hypothetical protein DRZ79_05680 [Candidatus Cloacimonadota bacterium]